MASRRPPSPRVSRSSSSWRAELERDGRSVGSGWASVGVVRAMAASYHGLNGMFQEARGGRSGQNRGTNRGERGSGPISFKGAPLLAELEVERHSRAGLVLECVKGKLPKYSERRQAVQVVVEGELRRSPSFRPFARDQRPLHRLGQRGREPEPHIDGALALVSYRSDQAGGEGRSVCSHRRTWVFEVKDCEGSALAPRLPRVEGTQEALTRGASGSAGERVVPPVPLSPRFGRRETTCQVPANPRSGAGSGNRHAVLSRGRSLQAKIFHNNGMCGRSTMRGGLVLTIWRSLATVSARVLSPPTCPSRV